MKRLLCYIFGHKYFVIKRFTSELRHIGCYRCKLSWGMNDRVKAFIPWDEELSRMIVTYDNQKDKTHETDYKEKYKELIMAVENKYKGETRHETALRYIRQAEKSSGGSTQDNNRR